jgi:hypothetical protein
MTERTPRDRPPADENAPSVRRESAHEWLDDMRAARRAERAPDDVRERLLERARELGQAVEGHAPSVPLGVEPALSLGLLNEGLLSERRLPERRQAERFGAEPGLPDPWTHPLLARVAGAGLMIGLVVLVIADVRRPGSGLPALDAPVPEGSAAPLSVGAAAVDRALGTETPASGDSPSEPALLATGPAALALAPPSEVRPELSGLASQVSRALLATAPRSPAPRVKAARMEDARPADSASPVWLSPHAALSAIRAVTRPYLDGAASYPRGTRVRARGNIRPDSGGNFITNGDFSRGDVMWSVRSWQGFSDTSVAAYYSVQAGALCTTLERNQQVLGGWPWDDRRLSPSSFELERGKRYRLSLRAWSSGPELVQLVVKVGHQQPPYDPALVARVPITAEPGRFDVDFVAARRDTFAGFAFVATSPSDEPLSEFCIDDVSVRPIEADL